MINICLAKRTLVGSKFIFMIPLLIVGICCNPIEPPTEEEFPIYVNTLSSGFDIGVDTSEKRRDWLTETDGSMCMAYPSGQQSGSVFIVAGAVAFVNVTEDFSNYSTLAVDLKGTNGDECILLSIEDVQKSPTKAQFAFNLDSNWETYYFSLFDFGSVDLSKLHTVTKFSFGGEKAQTVYFRNLKFLKDAIISSDGSPFYVFICNLIPPGYEIGIAKDSLSTNPEPIVIEIIDNNLKINYPAGNEWGTVFIYQEDGIPQDFSIYSRLFMEIRGEKGDEIVHVGLRDSTNFPSDVKLTLQNDWQNKEIPMTACSLIKLEKLLVILSLSSFEERAQTIYLRNVRFVQD